VEDDLRRKFSHGYLQSRSRKAIMREYNSHELDLMAEAYERACEELSSMTSDRSADTETARSRLVDGIVEAMDRGERSVDVLVAASLSTLSDLEGELPKANGTAPSHAGLPGRSRPYPGSGWVVRPIGLRGNV
jgi:hypothetical protein